MKTGNKTALLFMLYLSQGLPFGFQATALPVLLREQGVSLAAIGFAGALALPWFLKPLWAPLVDRFWSAHIGRRRSWIIPLQICMVFTMLVSVPIAASGEMAPLLACIFLMNLCAATQDIAVDGLAVDILGQKELGPGNAAQVAGYKMGMVLGGGILVWMSARAGWSGLFLTMAVVAVLPLILILFHREVEPNEPAGYSHPKSADFMNAFLAAWRAPGAVFFCFSLPPTKWASR
ncbi:MAG: MFS transporter [Smithella sp.]